MRADAAPQVHVADGAAADRVAARVDLPKQRSRTGATSSGARAANVGREPARQHGVDDRAHALRAHGLRRARPSLGRRQHGAVAISTRLSTRPGWRMRERLRRHAAERQADDVGLLDAERVEQPGEVVGESRRS